MGVIALARSARGVVAMLVIACGAIGCIGGVYDIGSSTPAGAAVQVPAPGDVTLSTSLPDFAAEPAGILNGPVSTKTLLTYTSDSDLITEIKRGIIEGYLRSWRHTYPDGTGVVTDLVVKFPDALQTAEFLVNLTAALTAQHGVSAFAVATPTGAQGYTAHGDVVPGSTDVAVSFGRGDYASFVLAATPGGSVTKTQIEQLAHAQWAVLPAAAAASASSSAAPGVVPTTLPSSVFASPSSGGIQALVVLFVVALAVCLLVLWAVVGIGRRRSRREGSVENADAGSAMVGAGPLVPDQGDRA